MICLKTHIPVHLLAPVPPSCPEIVTWSAPPLATFAETIPTPASETNLTLTRALGFAHFKS